jgi:hypothetical protein
MRLDLGPEHRVQADKWKKMQAQAQRAAPKALKELIALIHDKSTEFAKDADGNVLFSPKGKAVVLHVPTPPGVRLAAIKELLDRAFGRAPTMDIADMPVMQAQLTEIVRRIVRADSYSGNGSDAYN